ncbi:MAG: flagellar hook-length control protein FliK [Planctomycetes bacterium]|nr:flagellar hook-length control protein FliK [Planctomycetota bacterium]
MIARKVQRALRGVLRRGESHLRLRLDPPQFGRIDVEVRWGSDRLGVHLEVDSPEIRDAISKHLATLEEMLDAYGEQGGAVTIDLKSSGGESQRETPASFAARSLEEVADPGTEVPEVEVLDLSGSRGRRLDLRR